MKTAIKYIIAYSMWIIDLGLALWLFFISRTALRNLLLLFYKPGNLTYGYRVDFIDKIFSLVVGLGWLLFSIFSEGYFRTGVNKEDLPKRVARVTGALLLCIFFVNLILFWLPGPSSSWLSWLILLVELGGGIGLLVLAKTRFTFKSN
jgi:formate hydrogenlyase subunit 3/multisubunit Na+/H+ antiporter MnhD subunit